MNIEEEQEREETEEKSKNEHSQTTGTKNSLEYQKQHSEDRKNNIKEQEQGTVWNIKNNIQRTGTNEQTEANNTLLLTFNGFLKPWYHT